jgi:uncharacterized protein
LIVPDVNLMVYAHDKSSPFHSKARAWWHSACQGGQPIGIPWVVILGFLRIVTNPSRFNNPVPVASALAAVDLWLLESNVQILEPGQRHWSHISSLLTSVGVGRLSTDAHIAALAIEHHAVVATNDADFQRFPGLRTINPVL